MKILNEKLSEKEQQVFGVMITAPVQIWSDVSDVKEATVYGDMDSLKWAQMSPEELTSTVASLVEKGWVSITPVKYQFPESNKTRFDQLYIEKKTTPEEFAIEMQKIKDIGGIYEVIHHKTDKLLIKVLRQQGFEKGCDIFEKMGKWYS